MLVTDYLGIPGNHETLTPTSSTGFTTSALHPTSGIVKGMQAKAAFVTIETNSVNVSLDGTAATAAAGTDNLHTFTAGESFTLTGAEALKLFRCIDHVNGSASKVKVTFYF